MSTKLTLASRSNARDALERETVLAAAMGDQETFARGLAELKRLKATTPQLSVVTPPDAGDDPGSR